MWKQLVEVLGMNLFIEMYNITYVQLPFHYNTLQHNIIEHMAATGLRIQHPNGAIFSHLLLYM